MRILVIQHEDQTPAGLTIEWARHKNIHLDLRNSCDLTPAFSLDTYDGFLILGGSMDTDQAEELPWLKSEKILIQQILKTTKPVLGICLGSQLLAEALGARVFEAPIWEIGWHPVQISDPTFQFGQKELSFFHWHHDAFELPKGARSMGLSEGCQVQGFSVAGRIFAVQFHPEADAPWIELSLEDWTPTEPGFVQDSEQIRALTERNLGASRRWYFEFLSFIYKA